jgi:hypothetical protein
LRRELTTRAEAKIRAEAHAKAVETELSVMEAGSSAMHDEVERLAAERQDLTDQLVAATGSFDGALNEIELELETETEIETETETESSVSASPEAGDEPEIGQRRSSEEYLPDC